jgi:hypothetical protein
MSFFIGVQQGAQIEIVFRKILGKEKNIFFVIHPTPKGPCGGSGRLPMHICSSCDPVGPYKHRSNEKLDFKKSLLTSVGAIVNSEGQIYCSR